MNPWRWVPPAYSPFSWAAAVASVGRGDAAEGVERLLREHFAATSARLLDSGTSALALSLTIAVEQGSRRVVALPAYGCFDLATAADAAGVDVALYDVDPRTLSADLGSLDRVLASGVAAVVAVHFYGVPANLDEIAKRCSQAGTLLIEDAAQGVGGSLNGKPLGAHGDLSVLSFGRGKGRSAGGGGALLFRSPALEGRAVQLTRALPRAEPAGLTRVLRMLGQDLLSRPGLYGIPARIPALGLGDTPYHAVHPAMRMDADAAALVRAALALEETDTKARSERALQVLQRLPASAALALPASGVAGFLRMPVFLQRTSGRGERSSRKLGIEPGYPLALSDLPGFTRASVSDGGPWTGARALASRLVTLPVHSRVSDADLARAVDWVRARIS